MPRSRIASSSASAGGATKPIVGVTRRSSAFDQPPRSGARYAVAGAAGGGDLVVGHAQAALELAADVLAVLVRALGEEAAMDVGGLAHEQPVLARVVEREVDRAAVREARRGLLDAGADERVGVLEPGDADAEIGERVERRRLELRRERPHELDAAVHARRDRADVVVARREREAALGRDEAVRRLEADDAAPRGGDPDRAAGVGSERELDVARRDRRRRAAARAAGEPARDSAGSGRCRSAGSATRSRTRTRAGSSSRRPRSRPPRAARRPARSATGTCSAKSADPYVVTRPAVSRRSLTATGTPSRGSSGRASQIPSTGRDSTSWLLGLRLGLRPWLRRGRSRRAA